MTAVPRALDAPLVGGFGARAIGRHFVRGGRAVVLLVDPEPSDEPIGLAALGPALAQVPGAWLGRRVPIEVTRRGDGEGDGVAADFEEFRNVKEDGQGDDRDDVIPERKKNKTSKLLFSLD